MQKVKRENERDRGLWREREETGKNIPKEMRTHESDKRFVQY